MLREATISRKGPLSATGSSSRRTAGSLHVFIRIGGEKEKCRMKVSWKGQSRGEGERVSGELLSESGVHSALELHDFECFVPLQFGAGQVLLQLQQHGLLQTALVGNDETG